MVAIILDGKSLATSLENDLAKKIQNHPNSKTRKPALAVILVGNDPASVIYIKNKQNACLRIGITPLFYHLPNNITENDLLKLISELNDRIDVDGILVQLPLPAHIEKYKILLSINPNKDVDGFHPLNIGKLAQGHPGLRPCTPMGIMLLLQHYKIDVSGVNAVIVGASNIVGRPMSYELTNAGATVTLCHSKTKNLEEHVRKAQIVITATGQIDLIKTHWLNNCMTVIDVGIHRDENGKIRGEIDYHNALNQVYAITPVPGGIGPLTVCSLLLNVSGCFDVFNSSNTLLKNL